LPKDEDIYRYFIQLYKGEIGLYSKNPTIYEPREPSKTGYDEPQPANFNKEPTEYYVQFDNNVPIELPSWRWKALQLFEKKGYDIKSYVRKNNIRTTPEEYKKMVKHINEMK